LHNRAGPRRQAAYEEIGSSRFEGQIRAGCNQETAPAVAVQKPPPRIRRACASNRLELRSGRAAPSPSPLCPRHANEVKTKLKDARRERVRVPWP
jgi:hypothetical protein